MNILNCVSEDATISAKMAINLEAVAMYFFIVASHQENSHVSAFQPNVKVEM
jgi:hypothetical protein